MNQGIIQVSELKEGKVFEFEGKKWEFLGIKADGSEAYFMNTRSKKYPSYCWINHERLNLWNLTRMDCTREQLEKAHGF